MTTKRNAYTSFRNDENRLKALISRDIRLVLVAAIRALLSPLPLWLVSHLM